MQEKVPNFITKNHFSYLKIERFYYFKYKKPDFRFISENSLYLEQDNYISLHNSDNKEVPIPGMQEQLDEGKKYFLSRLKY